MRVLQQGGGWPRCYGLPVSRWFECGEERNYLAVPVRYSGIKLLRQARESTNEETIMEVGTMSMANRPPPMAMENELLRLDAIAHESGPERNVCCLVPQDTADKFLVWKPPQSSFIKINFGGSFG